MIEYHFGSGACTWTKVWRDGTRHVEFVHMTKVFPAPTRPWGWCGESVIFNDWKVREAAKNEAVRKVYDTFNPGDVVAFDHKGVVKQGAFSHITRAGRAQVLVSGEGKWSVPASLIRAA